MGKDKAVDNLKIWDAVKRPPADALRQITGGRLKGMTDINPQWRYKAMTEMYGPCGIGWGYTIKRVWSETQEDEILCFAEVDLWYDSNKENVIPGIGGSKLRSIEKHGPHNSDEGYKMAVTDALSVAMKPLGVGADVYAGRWDGSKYRDSKDAPKKPTPKPKVVTAESTDDDIQKQIDEARAGTGGPFNGPEEVDESAALEDAPLPEIIKAEGNNIQYKGCISIPQQKRLWAIAKSDKDGHTPISDEEIKSLVRGYDFADINLIKWQSYEEIVKQLS